MIAFIPAPDPKPDQVEAEEWCIGLYQPTDSVWPRCYLNQTKAGVVLALQFGPESGHVHACLSEIDALDFLDCWLGEHGQVLSVDVAELLGRTREVRPGPANDDPIDFAKSKDPVVALITAMRSDARVPDDYRVSCARLLAFLERQGGRA